VNWLVSQKVLVLPGFYGQDGSHRILLLPSFYGQGNIQGLLLLLLPSFSFITPNFI